MDGDGFCWWYIVTGAPLEVKDEDEDDDDDEAVAALTTPLVIISLILFTAPGE